ncbi:MAG TPA: hypothetical protein VEG62_00340 [Acidimicrobiales bacterium]|nr:hypothetical protein [Acidimicrobiales bacterium]
MRVPSTLRRGERRPGMSRLAQVGLLVVAFPDMLGLDMLGLDVQGLDVQGLGV